MENRLFGERIKNLRNQKKMTQQELGNVVGLTSTGISYWESGKAIPNFETMTKLSDYFGVSIDYLTGKDELDNKGLLLFRKAEKVNEEDREKMYNIIDSTIDVFLQGNNNGDNQS